MSSNTLDRERIRIERGQLSDTRTAEQGRAERGAGVDNMDRRQLAADLSAAVALWLSTSPARLAAGSIATHEIGAAGETRARTLVPGLAFQRSGHWMFTQ